MESLIFHDVDMYRIIGFVGAAPPMKIEMPLLIAATIIQFPVLMQIVVSVVSAYCHFDCDEIMQNALMEDESTSFLNTGNYLLFTFYLKFVILLIFMIQCFELFTQPCHDLTEVRLCQIIGYLKFWVAPWCLFVSGIDISLLSFKFVHVCM